MPPLLAVFAAAVAAVKQLLLPQTRPPGSGPKVVGVPSVNNRMYRSGGFKGSVMIALSSVWSHSAIAYVRAGTVAQNPAPQRRG